MKSDPHIRLFGIIAPVYSLFYRMQYRNYQKVLEFYNQIDPIASYSEILDIGCGTGALAAALSVFGGQVTGMDGASKMLEYSKKRHSGIRWVQADLTKPLPFPDQSFDLVTASYVMHGFKPEARCRIYAEISRVARNRILLIDYGQKRNPVTDLVEWMEGGDYFNFIKNIEGEMAEYFKKTNKYTAPDKSCIYTGLI